MFLSRLRWLAPLPLFIGTSLAPAQSPPVARPDPLDASAAVPPLVYRSPLAGYRPMSDQPVGAWREANDTVGRIGGWRAYAREAAAPPPPAAGASASGAASATPAGTSASGAGNAAPASASASAAAGAVGPAARSPAAPPSGHTGHHPR